MPFEVKIGERDVVAYGRLVLQPNDREVTFVLEDMHCIMAFLHEGEGPGQFRVSFNRRDPTHLHVETRGYFPAGAVAWTFAGILQLAQTDIDLDLTVQSDGVGPTSPRRIDFTFTRRRKMAATMIDPTSASGAALAHSGSAPPPLIVRAP
jgi:hypothetical protein